MSHQASARSQRPDARVFGVTEHIPDAETLKAFNAKLVEEFRANGGRVGGQHANTDLLLLTTTGAKSGEARLTPLAYLRIDGKLIVIGAYHGADFNPAWVHNLRADPRAHVEVGTESFEVTACELPPRERDGIFIRVNALAPVTADYQTRTGRVIPLFELRRLGRRRFAIGRAIGRRSSSVLLGLGCRGALRVRLVAFSGATDPRRGRSRVHRRRAVALRID